MPASNCVLELNRELARRINDEARRDPHSPFAGKFVGIANGNVVSVGDDIDTILDQLEQLEPDPARRCCVEASIDYAGVEEI